MTIKKPFWKHEKGFKAERTCQVFLEKKGWRVLFANVECIHVQIDLLARDPQGVLTVVEVKAERHAPAHLTASQIRRLFGACEILAQFEPVQLVLARVRPQAVVLVPVDGLTRTASM